MGAGPFLPAARAEFLSVTEQYADAPLELADDFIAEVERSADAWTHVVAVAHQRRTPLYWKERIQPAADRSRSGHQVTCHTLTVEHSRTGVQPLTR